MADTYTTNLNLTKPEPGAAEDTWGISLNADLDALDAIFSTSGTQINLNPNQVNFADNKKAIFGTGSDLQIFHDGNNSHVRDQGTGNILISASDKLIIRDTTDGAQVAVFDTDGAVSLNYGNSTKFATTSTGIDVTGRATADGLTSEGTLGNWEISDGGNVQNFTRAGANYIRANNASGLLRFETGGQNLRQKIAANGNIIFYDNTATNESFFWNAAVQRLGLGTTTPSYTLDVRDDSNIQLKLSSTTATNNARMVYAINNVTKWNVGVQASDGSYTFYDNSSATTPIKIEPGAAANTFVVDTNSRIGIGTSSPSSALDVTGTVKGDGLEARKDTGSTTNSLLKLTNSAGSTTDGVGITFEVANTSGAGGSVNVVRDGSNFKPYMTLNTSANVSTAPSQRVRIDDTGINVTGTASADILQSKNGKIFLDDNGTHNGVINAPASLFINFDSDNTSASEKIVFGYDRDSTSSSGGTTVMEIDSSGIDVTGTISSGAITSTGNSQMANLVVTGDLTVQGTTTTVNTNDLNVKDKNITLNYSTGDSSASANGAGITIQDAVSATQDATLTWNTANDSFNFSHNLNFADNIKAQFGAGNDLQIYHDGNNSNYIKSTTSDIYLRNEGDNDKIYFQATNSGTLANYLTIDGNAGLTKFNKNTKHLDNIKATFGDSGDLEIYHDGSNSIINDNGTGTIRIQTGGSNQWEFNGVNFKGNDGRKIILGDSSDLQIYHDGSNSYVKENGTGDLYLQGTSLVLSNSVGANYLVAYNGGSVNLYHNANQKLKTTSTGIDVTGTVKGDGLIINGGASSPTHLINGSRAGTLVSIDNESTSTSTGLLLNTASTNANSNILQVTSNDLNRFKVSGNGDISFYDDTGSTQGLFWDASAEKLGLGTTSPSAALHISGTSADQIRLERTNHDTFRIGLQSAVGLGFHNVTDNRTDMMIKGDGSVGIGTSSPARTAVINSSGTSTLQITNDTTGVTTTDGLQIKHYTSGATQIWNYENSYIAFGTNNLERARIDSSGNLLVGKTSTNYTVVGTQLAYDGAIVATRSANPIITLNRLSTDGEIQRFYKDGTQVGTIGTRIGDLLIGTGNTGLQFYDAGREIIPRHTDGSNIDAAVQLGSAGSRFTDLYLSDAIRGDVKFENNTGTTEYARFDTSGNLLVGKTSADFGGTQGVELRPTGNSYFTASSGNALRLNRTNSDGAVLTFRKDNGTIGSINAVNGDISIGTGDTGFRFHDSNDYIEPFNISTNSFRDNAISLGTTGSRFKNLHLSGTINVGDGHTIGNDASDNLLIAGSSGENIIIDSADDIILDSDGGDVIFKDGGVEQARLKLGKFGIGTTSPDALLHLSANTGATLRLESTDTAIAANEVMGAIEWEGNDATTGSSGIAGKIDVIAEDATPEYSMRFFTQDNLSGTYELAERMRIKSDGKVGIGTTSPTETLHVMSGVSNDTVAIITGSQSDRGLTISTYASDGRTDGGVDFDAYKSFKFTTDGSERARIDSGGNLLVGKTASSFNLAGAEIRDSGVVIGTVDGAAGLIANRLTSDGTLIQLSKDGSTVGSISSYSSGLDIAGSSYGVRFAGSTIFPVTSAGSVSNGAVDLGYSSGRFKDLHLSGTANVSTIASTGSMTLDVGANLTIDVDGTTIVLNDGGLNWGQMFSTGAGAFNIYSPQSNQDIVFRGVDGGNNIIALTLDMSVGGQLKAAPLGVSTPTYAFSNDSNTGMTRPTGDTLQFVTAGQERVRITDVGNVGIGTSSLIAKLHVKGAGNTSSTNAIFADNSSSAGIFAIRDNGDAFILGNTGIGESSPDGKLHIKGGTATGDASHVLFENTQGSKVFAIGGGASGVTNNNLFFRNVTDNTTPMVITDAGNVGIGISSPSAPLVVNATSSHEGIRVQRNGVSSQYISINQATGGDHVIHSFGNKPLHIGVNDAQPLILKTNNTERMRIDSSGNIGIGDTAPQDYLEINGSGRGLGGLTISNSSASHAALSFARSSTATARIYANEPAALHTSGLRFQTSDASGGVPNLVTAMFIDEYQKVGIGTTTPNLQYFNNLVVGNNSAGDKGITIRTSSSSMGVLAFSDTDSANASRYDGYIAYHHNGSSMRFNTNGGNERMRIDASGNIGIGTSSPGEKLHVVGNAEISGNIETSTFLSTGNATVEGTFTSEGLFTTENKAQIEGIKSGSTNPIATIKNRHTTNTDGTLVDFLASNDNLRGSIGTRQSENNTNLYIIGSSGTYQTGLKFLSFQSYRAIYPAGAEGATTDNTIDLGYSSGRFQDIYATNGTIQTSDKNEKQDIQALTDAEQRVATACKGLIRRFRWQDAVEKKDNNPDSDLTARYHFGVMAQDLQDAFEAEGLDAGDYGMFISSTWTDDEGNEQTRLGVRYNELLAFIITTL